MQAKEPQNGICENDRYLGIWSVERMEMSTKLLRSQMWAQNLINEWENPKESKHAT